MGVAITIIIVVAVGVVAYLKRDKIKELLNKIKV
jgi:hypothetical protein